MHDITSELRKGKAILLDVRTVAEWREAHAIGAVHIPVDSLAADYKSKLDPKVPVYIYCGSGKRAGVAKSFLDERGYSAINIGGLSDWMSAGGEIDSGEKS